MHILVLPSWYPNKASPATGIFLRDQAIALKSSGHKVGVVAPILTSARVILSNPKLFLIEASNEPHHLIDTKRGDPETFSESIFAIPRAHRINASRWTLLGERLVTRYISQFGVPDLLHAHCALYGGVLARAMSEKYGVPFVVTEHSSAYGRGLLGNHDVSESREVFLAAAARIAVGTKLVKDVGRVTGMDLGPWEIVPNVVDSFFLDAELSPKIRTGRRVRLLSVAFLSANKGIDLTLRALSILHPSDRPHFYIGGDGEERHKLKLLTQELGIEESVTFLGSLSRDEVRYWLSQVDVLVVSSQYETFGVIVIEAMAMGLPILSTACGGPEDTITHESGMIVASRSVEAWAEGIHTLVNQLEDYDAQRIRTICRDRFSYRAVATSLSNIFEKVISGYIA